MDLPTLALVETLPIGAVLLTAEGRLVRANGLFGELAGELAEGDIDWCALLGRLESERQVPWDLHVPVLVSGGKVQGGWLLTFTDVSTERKAAEGCRRQYEILAELSNSLLGSAEHYREDAQELAEKVRQRNHELHEANMDAIYMLAVASEAKDEDTGRHVRRIGKLSRELALRAGFSVEAAREVGYSSVLHDVGKMHVPDVILKKPGPLDAQERATVEQHTVWGERILADRPFFRVARLIARSHHENFDGSGYPDAHRHDEIPMPARIVHIVDVFDALTNLRAYKAAWPFEKAMAEVRAGRGTMFDPDLVDVFEAMLADRDLESEPAARPEVVPDACLGRT